jgi:hypothetical protein
MKKRKQLKTRSILVLGKKETEGVFYESLFFIFLSIVEALSIWIFRTSRPKITNWLKILWQSLKSKFSFQWDSLEVMFLLVALNLIFWGWLNKVEIIAIYKPLIKEIREISIPIALGKMEEGVILGAEDAVKINDLQKKSLEANSEPGFLGEAKNLNFSLTEERCQKNKPEKKSSELCGKYEKDEALEKELAKLDYLDKLKRENSIKKSAKNNAPGPYVFEKDSLGRRVCNKSNDKPSKSDKGKGKHMDMECCLDPDEYPNPHCYYPLEKYGKYLK